MYDADWERHGVISINGTLYGTITIKGRDVAKYLRLRAQGFVTLSSGEGVICMREPGPKEQTRSTH